MYKMALGVWVVWIATAGWAAETPSFYAGISGGLAMPMNMLEEWSWPERGQQADLKEEMNNGFVIGAKAGWIPAVLGGRFAAELEYSYRRAGFDKIMSPGFAAGPYTIRRTGWVSVMSKQQVG